MHRKLAGHDDGSARCAAPLTPDPSKKRQCKTRPARGYVTNRYENSSVATEYQRRRPACVLEPQHPRLFFAWRGVSRLRLPANGFSPVRSSTRTGVP